MMEIIKLKKTPIILALLALVVFLPISNATASPFCDYGVAEEYSYYAPNFGTIYRQDYYLTGPEGSSRQNPVCYRWQQTLASDIIAVAKGEYSDHCYYNGSSIQCYVPVEH